MEFQTTLRMVQYRDTVYVNKIGSIYCSVPWDIDFHIHIRCPHIRLAFWGLQGRVDYEYSSLVLYGSAV
ncbi:hypothetical protein SERLADRAFT_462192 [Serpula lacrymans var. lacrymans S7.9]|uniref:Uncharacterized protein n=1 Tax=Serpula lacrymans var. lacrymans (strain S7.9) TaxID=578457 RepID=F8NMU6_SERL9|nr:uncharacterized protein SERLADRAFT_462192 [Serpula lacrymans var. lacrymans S7.9]EGO27922.1 hypothetical protein SERLADRAFT_462192 [Serpula lacrymans var. lacrymans S7.9]